MIGMYCTFFLFSWPDRSLPLGGADHGRPCSCWGQSATLAYRPGGSTPCRRTNPAHHRDRVVLSNTPCWPSPATTASSPPPFVLQRPLGSSGLHPAPLLLPDHLGDSPAALYWFLARTDTGHAHSRHAQDGTRPAHGRATSATWSARLRLDRRWRSGGSADRAHLLHLPRGGRHLHLKASSVVVLGGRAAIVGATLAAGLIGMSESLSASTSFRHEELCVYVIFLLVLLLNLPSLGRAACEGVLPWAVRRWRWPCPPLHRKPVRAPHLHSSLHRGGPGESWNVIGGFAGQYSVGHAAWTARRLRRLHPAAAQRHPTLVRGLGGGSHGVIIALAVGWITSACAVRTSCWRASRGGDLRLAALNWKILTNGAEGILGSDCRPCGSPAS